MAKKDEPKVEKVKTPEEEFAELIVKFKKEKSKEELEKMVSIKPANYELRDFLAAREALKQLSESEKSEEPTKKKVEK